MGVTAHSYNQMEYIIKKITRELLARGFINNNINTPSKESMFVYIFNKAIEVANAKKKSVKGAK